MKMMQIRKTLLSSNSSKYVCDRFSRNYHKFSNPATKWLCPIFRPHIRAPVFIANNYKIVGTQNVLFHTSVPSFTSQAANFSYTVTEEEYEVCPQGVQGEDCEHFKIWMHNCQRYGIPGCEKQANHVVTGRKTISEVFIEQEKIIRDIAVQYKQRWSETKKTMNTPSQQGIQDVGYDYSPQFDASDSSVQGVQGLDIIQDLINVTSPQGIQGDDCIQFKLWLENCHRFGISNECEQQMEGILTGRKTLAQVFEEQDSLIRQIVQDYKQRANSTNDKC